MDEALSEADTSSETWNVQHPTNLRPPKLDADKRLSLIVGVLSDSFVGHLRQGHKEAHDEHHLYLNSELDADRIWCEPEAKVDSMLRGWLYDFLLVSAARSFLQYIPSPRREARRPVLPVRQRGIAALADLAIRFLPVAAAQLALILVYAATPGFAIIPGIGYCLFIYIFPLWVLYPAQIRLCSNVEHSFAPGHRFSRPQDRRVTRSVKPNWLEKLIISLLHGEYHCEHHILPTLPYYNAPKLWRIFASKGFTVPMADGYVSFIWRTWLAERQLDRRAHAA